MKPQLAIVLLTCAAGGWAGGAVRASEDNRILLESIQQLRAAAIAEIPRTGSGGGILTLHDERLNPAGVRDEPKVRVEFAFRDGRSLLRKLGGQGKTTASYLWTDHSVACYRAASEKQNGGVIINPLGHADLSIELTGWSPGDMMAMPLPYSEDRIFSALESRPDVVVTHHGDAIAVHWTDQMPAHKELRAEYWIEFNVAEGGMMTSYRNVYHGSATLPDGRSHGVDSDVLLKYMWRREAGHVVLVSRSGSAFKEMDGVIRNKSNIDLKIEKVAFGAGPAKPLSLDAMGIPGGTPVMDIVRAVQFRYFPGAGDVVDSNSLRREKEGPTDMGRH